MSVRGYSRRDFVSAAGGAVAASTFGWSRELRANQTQSNDKDLNFLTSQPRNGEPTLENLIRSWLTPTKLFYVRSHAPNPQINPDSYRLRVEGLVRRNLTLSLEQLVSMQKQTVTATLTCAGNRRSEFNAEGKVGGVQWGPGAIGNATWTGVPLADVLNQAELLEGARHVWFEGLDQVDKDGETIPFGGSIPVTKARQSGDPMGPLLAFQMNGQALSPDHGFPLRTVVPGYIGARSVKWLGKIVVSDRPSPNHYLATAYKLVRGTSALDWSESGPIYRYPINGAIANIRPGATLPAGELSVTGYVLPSGRPGARIRNVEVSTDGGSTWTSASMVGTDAPFCWQLWAARIAVKPSSTELLMRAEDTAGGFMPRRVAWNAKGYLQNSWYRVPIRVS